MKSQVQEAENRGVRTTRIRQTVKRQIFEVKMFIGKYSEKVCSYTIMLLESGIEEYLHTPKWKNRLLCSPIMRTKQLNSHGSESLLYRSRANTECKAVDSFEAKHTLLLFS